VKRRAIDPMQALLIADSKLQRKARERRRLHAVARWRRKLAERMARALFTEGRLKCRRVFGDVCKRTMRAEDVLFRMLVRAGARRAT
jgi:hypothetical protein